MKTTLLTTLAVALGLSVLLPLTATAQASDGMSALQMSADSDVEKRRKPRVKGGSGCDDAGDAAEHPECR